MEVDDLVRTGRAFDYTARKLSVSSKECITHDRRALQVITVEGHLNLIDLRASFAAKRASGALDHWLPSLWDLRGHDFAPYDGAEFRGLAFMLGARLERDGPRHGYLVDSELGFGMMRMFQGVATGAGRHAVTPFCVDYDSAPIIDWLVETPEERSAYGLVRSLNDGPGLTGRMPAMAANLKTSQA